MNSPDHTADAFQFGRFRVLTRSRELLADGLSVELSSRAFDILLVLIEAGGAVVTKDELLQRVWPTVIVEENTLQSHVYALRKALGDQRDLVMTVPGRGYRFVGDVRPLDDQARLEQRSEAGIGIVPARGLSNLPAAISPLIGRVQQLKDVLALLAEHRSVTLTGPGGIGKTRLALEAARGLVPTCRDGVWLVELASLSNPDLVGTAILSALGLQSTAIRVSRAQMHATFGDKRMLVVLDNCEHVVVAAAQVVEDLLTTAPRMQVLATSRQPLGSEGEYTYQVPPLSTPPSDVRNLDAILPHEAVELFVSRTKAIASGFLPDEGAARALAAICRRLDGIPLAIELAAARAAGLGVHALAARLDHLFELLSRGRRTGLARHQTLSATLGWSYGLLPEDQRSVLRRTAVFAGGFTMHAASALATEPGQCESTIIDQLADLVEKSLVMADVGGTEPRYRLLETTRAYAQKRLDESGESEALKRRHAEYYRDLLATALHDESERGTWLSDIAPEIDNIRAALSWALGPTGDVSIGVALAGSAAPLWFQTSLPNECQIWLQNSVANLDVASARGTAAEMRAQAGLSMSLMLTKPTGHEAQAGLLRALELAETLEDKTWQLRTLDSLIFIHLRRADLSAALALTERMEAVARSAERPDGVMAGLRWRGFALHFAGDQAGALASLKPVVDADAEAAPRAHAVRFVSDHRASARCLLGNVLWLRGLPDQSREAMRGSVDEARRIGHIISLCHVLTFGATVTALRAGDWPAAERYADELLDRADKISSETYRAYGLAARAVARARQRDNPGAAVQSLRAALAAMREHRIWILSFMYSADIAEILVALGQVEEALAVLDEGLQIVDRNGGHGAMAELLRVKGEALLAGDRLDGARTAEGVFAQAIEWARRQGALSWELRAASSLARLRHQQGRTAEAYGALAPVYARFTEGFQTRDLQRAKAVLDELS
jgi:predicted ATPase/DNA-binding winged helix-turn-helix (wHTH) protein